MLLSNVYKHIAFPGWKSNVPPLKKNGGTDPARARHQTTTMYPRDFSFLNNKGYFSGLTTQKYRLTAMIPIVPRLFVPIVNASNPWNRQNRLPNIHRLWNRVKTVKGMQQVDIRISLTASDMTNMFGSVRSLWFLYTAYNVRRLPERAATLITASKTASVKIRESVLAASSRERTSVMA